VFANKKDFLVASGFNLIQVYFGSSPSLNLEIAGLVAVFLSDLHKKTSREMSKSIFGTSFAG
jgi:hypothetical protein